MSAHLAEQKAAVHTLIHYLTHCPQLFKIGGASDDLLTNALEFLKKLCSSHHSSPPANGNLQLRHLYRCVHALEVVTGQQVLPQDISSGLSRVLEGLKNEIDCRERQLYPRHLL